MNSPKEWVEVGGRRVAFERVGVARLVVLPGVGHVCNVEAPQQFNDTVRTWLADRSSGFSRRRGRRGG